MAQRMLSTHLFSVSLLATLALAAVACGDSSDPVTEPTPGDTSISPSNSASSSNSPSGNPAPPSPSDDGGESAEPSDDASATPPNAAGGQDLLLAPNELPRLGGIRWTADGADEAAEEMGDCTDLTAFDLGVTTAVHRDFAPVGGGTPDAEQIVAEFPDAKTAARAFATLRSTASRCSLDDAADPAITGPSRVRVPAGQAVRFFVSYGDDNSDDRSMLAASVWRGGRFLSLVQYKLVGQDYNYTTGQEPESRAARLVARKF